MMWLTGGYDSDGRYAGAGPGLGAGGMGVEQRGVFAGLDVWGGTWCAEGVGGGGEDGEKGDQKVDEGEKEEKEGTTGVGGWWRGGRFGGMGEREGGRASRGTS